MRRLRVCLNILSFKCISNTLVEILSGKLDVNLEFGKRPWTQGINLGGIGKQSDC
jgi:hypothetical protein